MKPAGGESSGLAETAFKEAISILKNNAESKALGLPAGIPASVWLDLERITHERDMEKSDLIEAERARKAPIKLAKDILRILGLSLPGLINILQGQTTPDQQAKLVQMLSQSFTPEEQNQLIESINLKSQTSQPPFEPSVEKEEKEEKEEEENAFVCPKCQTVSIYPLGSKVVECFSCGERYRVDFFCKKCGAKVLYNLKSESFKCPTCGANYRIKNKLVRG